MPKTGLGVQLATVLMLLGVGLAACAQLKASKPLLPMREYERLLTGPADADYIGNDNCLRACHEHDQLAVYLREGRHGQQTRTDNGMPLVNCETCHGPGSLAVAQAGKDKKCDTSQLVVTTNLPPMARDLLCMRCHSSYSMTNIQFWPASHHAQADLSCPDCHKLHANRRQKLAGRDVTTLCLQCHFELTTALSAFSRHPLAEGRMNCVSCHNPHGNMNENGLKALDQKELCLDCHGEKVGPFRFEHGGFAEECSTCHDPHGSPFANLLRIQEPFLCLDCHSGHTDFLNSAAPTAGFKQGFYTRCSNCHSQIHGTDSAADPGRIGFVE